MDEDLNRRLARIESAIELMREDLERQAGIQTQTQSLMVELMEVLTVKKEGEPLDQLLRSLIGGLNQVAEACGQTLTVMSQIGRQIENLTQPPP
jgi:GTP1/Obg family GTP-binding protein